MSGKYAKFRILGMSGLTLFTRVSGVSTAFTRGVVGPGLLSQRVLRTLEGGAPRGTLLRA